MSEEQAMQLAEESDRLSAEVNGQSLKGDTFDVFGEDLFQNPLTPSRVVENP